MHSIRQDQGFEAFLEQGAYEQAEGALLAIVRAAYLAGWRDAEQASSAPRLPKDDVF